MKTSETLIAETEIVKSYATSELKITFSPSLEALVKTVAENTPINGALLDKIGHEAYRAQEAQEEFWCREGDSTDFSEQEKRQNDATELGFEVAIAKLRAESAALACVYAFREVEAAKMAADYANNAAEEMRRKWADKCCPTCLNS